MPVDYTREFDPAALMRAMGLEDDYDSPLKAQARARALRGDPGNYGQESAAGMGGMMLRGPTAAKVSEALYSSGERGKRAYADQADKETVRGQEARGSALAMTMANMKDKRSQEEKARDDARQEKQWGAEFGLRQRAESRQATKDAYEMRTGGDWKVRVDLTGNPVGWYNDRGDYKTLDGQMFSVNGDNLGSGAPRGDTTASVAASGQPGGRSVLPLSTGRGNGGLVDAQKDVFGMSTGTAGMGRPSVDSVQTDTGPTQAAGGIDESRAASIRLGRIKGLSAEQQNKYGAALAQRDRLPSLIKDIEGNPQAFGIFSDVAQHIPGQPGSMGAVAQGIVRSTQDKFRDPKDAEVRSRVYKEAYEVIHALAGAALSTGEANRILGFMPGPTDPPEKILANLKAAEEEAYRTINTIESSAGVPEQVRSPRTKPASERGNFVPDTTDEQIIDVDY